MSYYISGRHSVKAALLNPRRKILEVLVCSLDSMQWLKDIELSSKVVRCKKYQIRQIEPRVLSSIVDCASHQGIGLKVLPIAQNQKDINLDEPNKVAILDCITDPVNMGSILRSAAFFGIDMIFVPKTNSAAETAVVAKVASGGLELVRLVYVSNISTLLETLKKHGFWILGMDANGVPMDRHFQDAKTAIVLGSEGKGMRCLTAKKCDRIYSIPKYISPMAVSSGAPHEVSSLNVAMAAAIAFSTFSPIGFE